MNKIWFMSDTHYNHRNMCYGESSWDDKETSTRKFESLVQMNNAIIDSINNCVGQDDTIYFLGDWSFGGIENIYTFWERLICKNINFIPGNHDHHIKKNINTGLAPQSLFTMLPELYSFNIGKKKFVLSHYPLEQWEEMDRGSIHLHGHCHGKLNTSELNTKYRRMDVGMDWKEFRPYSSDEIISIMESRGISKHISH